MFTKQVIIDCFQKVHNFFFDQVSANKVRVFTILLSVITLLNLLVFWNDFLVYFSNQSPFSAETIRRSRSTFGWSIFFVNDSVNFVSSIYYLSLVLCVLLGLSIFPRLCCFLLWVILFSLFNRNPYVFNAANTLLNFMLFCACFINPKSPKAFPFRFIQIQICLVYFFAFMSKTTSKGWMLGEYVFWMSNFPGRGYWDTVEFFRQNTILANLITYFVLAVEISFPFLVWFSKLTTAMLLLSFILHLGIDLGINTVYFSQVMWLGLVGFWVTIQPVARWSIDSTKVADLSET